MKTWEKDVITSVNGFENKDSLLLPVKHEYQPKGWCGNTGSAKVPLLSYRSPIKISPISSQKRSRTGSR